MSFRSRKVRGQVSNTATAIITAGANVTIQPTKLILFGAEADTNTDFYIVSSGGSADATTRLERVTSIAQFERVDISVAGVVLYDGDAIYLQTTTASRINYYLSYNERTGE